MDFIEARELSFSQLNETIRRAGKECRICACQGQRFIAAGMSGKTLVIDGVPGNALGAYLGGGSITVNGKKVNIPSYQVKAGDVIEVRESSRSSAKFAKLTGAEAPVVALPSWLDREAGTLKGVVNKLPERSDIDYEVAEHLIVELYSK